MSYRAAFLSAAGVIGLRRNAASSEWRDGMRAGQFRNAARFALLPARSGRD
jgi:hypothetical protein